MNRPTRQKPGIALPRTTPSSVCNSSSLLPPSIIHHLVLPDPPPHPSSSPETLSLQLEAIPDYPVAEGQRVNLHCKASTMPGSAQWSWQRLRNHTWHEMKTGGDLTLTEPEQSGLYRCRAERQFSQNHAVYITSMQTTGRSSVLPLQFPSAPLGFHLSFSSLFNCPAHHSQSCPDIYSSTAILSNI